MVVQYAPTGSMAYVPQHLPKGYASGVATFPTSTSSFGFGGEFTGGSYRAFDAKANDGHLVWMHAGSSAFFDVWQLDSPTAVQTALATIGAALAETTPPTFIILNSDGTLGS